MREVARQELSTGQTILIMELNEEYWFLGSSATGLSLLQKIAKADCPLPIPKHSSTSAANSFQSVFSQFIGAKA
jgi:hypothetical protein